MEVLLSSSQAAEQAAQAAEGASPLLSSSTGTGTGASPLRSRIVEQGAFSPPLLSSSPLSGFDLGAEGAFTFTHYLRRI